jgi:hypothetical protein
MSSSDGGQKLVVPAVRGCLSGDQETAALASLFQRQKAHAPPPAGLKWREAHTRLTAAVPECTVLLTTDY